MDNKIAINFCGGLGNKLFKCFTVISNAIDSNRDFIFYYIKNKCHRPLYDKMFQNVKDKIYEIDNDEYSKLENIHMEKRVGVYEDISTHFTVLDGYYQHSSYFNHNREKIIKYLKIDEMKAKNKFDFDKIIAIHFRFQDYIQLLGVLTPEYYINALNKLYQELGDDFYNYKFIVFSSQGENDDYLTNKYINCITRYLKKPIDIIKFCDLYPNIDTCDEFIYMSNCNYFIIPDSTFSWFAFYLCDYENKLAIAPNRLVFLPDSNEYYNLKGFIQIQSITYNTTDINLYAN